MDWLHLGRPVVCLGGGWWGFIQMVLGLCSLRKDEDCVSRCQDSFCLSMVLGGSIGFLICFHDPGVKV